jgi:hypothetical protein
MSIFNAESVNYCAWMSVFVNEMGIQPLGRLFSAVKVNIQRLGRQLSSLKCLSKALDGIF